VLAVTLYGPSQLAASFLSRAFLLPTSARRRTRSPGSKSLSLTLMFYQVDVACLIAPQLRRQISLFRRCNPALPEWLRRWRYGRVDVLSFNSIPILRLGSPPLFRRWDKKAFPQWLNAVWCGTPKRCAGVLRAIFYLPPLVFSISFLVWPYWRTPLVCSTEVKCCLMFNSFMSSLILLSANCVPLSVTTSYGTPNLYMIFFYEELDCNCCRYLG